MIAIFHHTAVENIDAETTDALLQKLKTTKLHGTQLNAIGSTTAKPDILANLTDATKIYRKTLFLFLNTFI